MNGPRPAIDWQAAISAAHGAPRPLVTDVTVVIPTLGRPLLADCLGALLAGEAWPGAVVVVDQGDSNEIAGWLSDLRDLRIDARHEPCAGRGRALGLNVGLGLVRTPFVAITDDDCLPGSGWVTGYAQRLRARPDTVYTGRVEAAGEERVLHTVTTEESCTSRRPGLYFDRLSGGNCGMSMAVLRRVGLFDDDPCVRFAEDGEWAYRALRAGVPIAYAPELVVSHRGWRTLEERLGQYRDYARSQGAFLGKHLRRGDAFIVVRTAALWARAAVRWLRGLRRRDPELAANGRSYATQLVPGLIRGLQSRRRPPSLA
jgi:hypothetical protein